MPPRAQLPILYHNASVGNLCTIDAFTGDVGNFDCAPYLETACKGRSVGNQSVAIFANETPAVCSSLLFLTFVKVCAEVPGIICWQSGIGCAPESLLLLATFLMQDVDPVLRQFAGDNNFIISSFNR